MVLDGLEHAVGREPLQEDPPGPQDLAGDGGDHPEQVGHGQGQERHGAVGDPVASATVIAFHRRFS